MSEWSLFIGRFQPFHEGHAAIISQLIAEGKFVCVGIRDTARSETNPHSFADRVAMIRARFPGQTRIEFIVVPDICEVVYGRSVGYAVREMRMSPEVEAISATAIRDAK